MGLPFDLLPKQIGHTEVICVPLPAYSVHTHSRAKDIVVDSLVWRLPPQRKTRAGQQYQLEIFCRGRRAVRNQTTAKERQGFGKCPRKK